MRVLLLVISGLLLASCSRKREALHYFTKITAYDKKLTQLLTTYEGRINQAINDRILSADYSRPDILRKEMIGKYNNAIAGLVKMKSFHGDTSLLNAALHYFLGIKDLYENEKKDMIRIRTHVVIFQSDSDSLEKLLGVVQMKVTEVTADFQKAQEAFAAKYGFPIINPGQ